MKYTGPLIERNKVDYGFVTAGDDRSFSFVIATFPIDGSRVLIAAPGDMSVEYVEQCAETHFAYAKALSDQRCQEIFMADILAYIRSLPRGHKFEHILSSDVQAREAAEEQVRSALLKAMGEVDSFRASVVLEMETPFLRADRRIVDIMDKVVKRSLRDFKMHKDDLMLEVADLMEDKILNKSVFMREQVVRAKNCVKTSSALSMH